ncbi:MAG: GNAT family protein [Pseudomonadota bacterium]
MAFLRTGLLQDNDPLLNSRRMVLRPPVMGDYAAWAELRAASRAHLTPWEPAWASDELTRTAYRRRVRVHQRDLREDQGYAFFLFRTEDDRMVGGLTLSNVRRGVTQAAALGYWIGAPFAGQGYMTEAVGTVAYFAFDVLRLNRLEAACLPSNTSSIRVLQKVGFQHEGLARRYLKIAGAWQDHLLFALLCDDPRPEGG